MATTITAAAAKMSYLLFVIFIPCVSFYFYFVSIYSLFSFIASSFRALAHLPLYYSLFGLSISTRIHSHLSTCASSSYSLGVPLVHHLHDPGHLFNPSSEHRGDTILQ
jgi:hypothetical protein